MFKWLFKSDVDKNKRENALREQLGEVLRHNHQLIEQKAELRQKGDDLSHNLIKLALKEESLQEEIRCLRTCLELSKSENAELRNGIGHLLHGMAAVQSLADGFVTRINMIPKFFGLGEPLAKEILEEFASKQNTKEGPPKKPKEAAEEPDDTEEPDEEPDDTEEPDEEPDEPSTHLTIQQQLQRYSYTFETYASNHDNSLFCLLEANQIAELINRTACLYNDEYITTDNIDKKFLENIDELGVYHLPIIGITSKPFTVKLWVVPFPANKN